MEKVNSYVIVMIVIFQTGFLESSDNTASVENIVSCIELLEICILS